MFPEMLFTAIFLTAILDEVVFSENVLYNSSFI